MRLLIFEHFVLKRTHFIFGHTIDNLFHELDNLLCSVIDL